MTAKSWWVVGVSILTLASTAAAQTVYRWTDDKGVVHFADEKPEGVKSVETLTLEAPAPMVSEGEGAGAPAGEPGGTLVVKPAGGAPQGGPQGRAPEVQVPVGPAEVVFLGADLANAGAATQRIVHGKLRNAGGVPARRVSVRVVIADGDTGNLCMAGEMNAEPSELGSGETAVFEGTLDTPCFYGNPKIAYYPEWD